MNPQLTVLRALSRLSVRKWAAEVLPTPVPQPVVPTPVPLPDGALDPSTQAPAVAPAPPAPGTDDPFTKFVPKTVPAAPGAPALSNPSPAIIPPAAMASPAPSLAAPVPADRTIEPPVPAAAIPPPKGEAAPAAAAPAAPAKSMFQTFKDKAIAAQTAMQDKVNSVIDEHVGGPIDGLHAMPDTDVMHTAGEFFSDWHNWLMPLAALGAMFGGTTGKVLGALAAVGGGVDLYNRYKGVEGLGQTPEGQKLIEQALTFKDAQGKAQPFGNVAELMKAAPEQAQALKDLSLAARLGAKNLLINRVMQAGIDQAEKQGVPAATVINRLIETKRISAQQGEEMLKNTAAAKQRLAQQAPAIPAAAHG